MRGGAEERSGGGRGRESAEDHKIELKPSRPKCVKLSNQVCLKSKERFDLLFLTAGFFFINLSVVSLGKSELRLVFNYKVDMTAKFYQTTTAISNRFLLLFWVIKVNLAFVYDTELQKKR